MDSFIEYKYQTDYPSKHIKSSCCGAPIVLMQNGEAFQMDIELIECANCGGGVGIVAGDFKHWLITST